MSNIKLTGGNTWDTSGIYDTTEGKLQSQVNSVLSEKISVVSDVVKTDQKKNNITGTRQYQNAYINNTGGATTGTDVNITNNIAVGSYKYFSVNYDFNGISSNAVGFYNSMSFSGSYLVSLIKSITANAIYEIPATTVSIALTYTTGTTPVVTFYSSKIADIEDDIESLEDCFESVPYDRQLYDNANPNILNAYSNGLKFISSNAHRIVWIPCEPMTTYTLSLDSTLWVSKGCVVSKDQPANNVACSNVTATSTTENGRTYWTFTTNADSNYIGVFYYNSNTTQQGAEAQVRATIMIAKGTARTAFYSYAEYSVLKDSALPYLAGLFVNHDTVAKGTSAELTTGNSVELTLGNIKKNNVLAFSANFADFGSLTIGQGREEINQTAYITIDDTYVKVYRYTTEPVEWVSLAHGLTIEDYISVRIEVSNSEIGYAKLSITSNGETYSYAKMAWMGCGAVAYATSVSGTYTNCVLTHYCADYDSDTWLFGDSYFDYWVTTALEDNYRSFLCDGYSGRNSATAWTSLNVDLTHGKPKTIVWCMGMNDADTESAVNASWLTNYTKLKNLCEEQEINLVLCTIPNVPSYSHTYKNTIIRGSGYSYIDLAKAVGSDISTSWYTGLLSSDNVHPSETGAVIIGKFMESAIPQIYSGNLETAST